MTIEDLARRRVPMAIGILIAALWLGTGIRRVDETSGIAVLDSPLHLRAARVITPGWHLAPPGLLRIAVYPIAPVAFNFDSTALSARLVSREGIEVVATGTLRYRVDPERVLEVHRLLGPRYERRALRRWVEEDLRGAVGAASYGDISGARADDLRESLGRSLADRFRAVGLVLLSCEISGVHILTPEGQGIAGAQRPTGIKVLLIGLDGADWNVLDPLIEAGSLPHIGQIAGSGARGRLRTIAPMLSPVIWTSIATGVLPGRHGIIDFLASMPNGDKVPVTSGLRRTRAVWNILSDAGVRVGVTGWWATYPAEKVDGFIVSDRIAYQLFGVHPARDQVREGKVYPPDLDPLVQTLTVAPESIGVGEVGRYVRLSDDPESLPAEQNKLIDDFRTLLAAGDTYARISEALAAKFRPDFQALYLEGTDTVAHLFMRYQAPPMPGVTQEESRRFSRVVAEYYRHADQLVGRMIEAAGPGTAVIICSDHGFRTGENRPLTDSRIGYGQAADWHRKYGVVMLSGTPFRRHHEIEEASVLDITPTLLALFGLPVAEDMDGRPILDAFEPAWLESHPVRYIRSYETAPVGSVAAGTAPAPADAAGDRDLKEKLRSLGYLSQDTANSHNNRGMLLLAQNKYDEAIAEFQQAINASENLGLARINLARACYRKRDFAAARRALDQFLVEQPRSKDAENLLGNIDMDEGRLGEAEAHFRKALEYEPKFTDALNSLGILYDRLGREEEAIAQFGSVLTVDPEYAEAYNNIGVIREKQGRAGEAIEAFRKAIAADSAFAGSYSNLALILERSGDYAGAEDQFRKALQRDPDNVAVRTNYGGLLYTQGRYEEARRELERSIEIDPGYASAYNNLGATYGKLGRSVDEIGAYRKAVAIDPGYADVHHNLGLALLKSGQEGEGERELRRALAVDPKYSSAYINLGRFLMSKNKLNESLEVLQNGASRLTKDSAIQSLLGEAWLRSGQRDKGIAALESSLRLKPDQPEVRRLIESARAGPGTGPPSGAPR